MSDNQEITVEELELQALKDKIAERPADRQPKKVNIDKRIPLFYQGFVYILTNPAWPEWVKVGYTQDINRRLGQYNPSSPFQDYEVKVAFGTFNAKLLETLAHTELEKTFTRSGEWFKCSVQDAIIVVQQAIRQMPSKTGENNG